MSNYLDIQTYLSYLQDVPNLALDPTATVTGSESQLLAQELQAFNSNNFTLNNTNALSNFVQLTGVNPLDLYTGTPYSVVYPSATTTDNWSNPNAVLSNTLPSNANTINKVFTLLSSKAVSDPLNHPLPSYVYTTLNPPSAPVTTNITINVPSILITSVSNLQATFQDLLNKLGPQGIANYNSLSGADQLAFWTAGTDNLTPPSQDTLNDRLALFYSWNFYRMLLDGTGSGGWTASTNTLPPIDPNQYFSAIVNNTLDPDGSGGLMASTYQATLIGMNLGSAVVNFGSSDAPSSVNAIQSSFTSAQRGALYAENLLPIQFNNYIATNPPTDPGAFFSGFNSYLATQGLAPPDSTSNINQFAFNQNGLIYELPTALSNPLAGSSISLYGNFTTSLLNNMLQEFASTLRITDDWANILPKLPNGQIDPVKANIYVNALFNNTFSAFVQYLNSTPGAVTSTTDFLKDWGNFIGPYLVLGAGPGQDPSTSTFTAFSDLWNSFFPTDPSGFLNQLSQFMNGHIQSHSSMVPGTLASDWFGDVTKKFFVANNLYQFDSTRVGNINDSSFVQILMRLFDLLSNMLGELQKMAAAKTARQLFDSKYEKAYTDLLTQVPNFTSGNFNQVTRGSFTKLNTDIARDERQDLGAVNAKVTEGLQSYRSIAQDTGKQNLTDIQQVNESVNQQANLLNTILQDLSGLLQSITK